MDEKSEDHIEDVGLWRWSGPETIFLSMRF